LSRKSARAFLLLGVLSIAAELLHASAASLSHLRDEIATSNEEKRSKAVELAKGAKHSFDDISSFAELLESEDRQIRRAAVSVLHSWGARGTKGKIRNLLISLPGPKAWDYDMRTGRIPTGLEEHVGLVRALADFDSLDSLEDLIKDEKLSYGSYLASQFGAKALPVLEQFARDSNVPLADRAKRSIGFIRDDAAIPGLVDLLNEDGDIGGYAAEALKYMPTASQRNREAIDSALNVASRSTNPAVKKMALSAVNSRSGENAPSLTLESMVSLNRLDRLTLFYDLMQSGRKEIVPVLKEFIAWDEKAHSNPLDTNQRKVAAQTIYRLSGERVHYLGVERDIEGFEACLYPDPYNPSGPGGLNMKRGACGPLPKMPK
jgi:HEAT repeat protein